MAEEKKTVELSQNQAMTLLRNEQTRLEAMEREFLQFRAAWEETLKAKEAVTAIQKTKPNESIMIPLGAGIFAAASLSDNQNVQTTLAGGVLKKDSTSEALQKLENRQKEIEQQLNSLQKELEQTAANVNNLSNVIQTVLQGQRTDANADRSPTS